MKADTLNLKALFQKEVRYVIPTFQRPYVWDQEKQWEPLWNDLRNTAENYLEALVDADGNNALAEERTGSHFMGAVVLQQQPTAVAEIDVRHVIDGQQRLTTMQLLADAAQEVFEELKAPEASRLAKLVVNPEAPGDAVFKLWPTSLDQDAFRAAMMNELSPEGFEDSLIVQAHDFFRLQIREWLDAALDAGERARRIHGLEAALFGLLEMVVIDLATIDDAFVIFETLNARGTPLLASDLVKNYVLQTVKARGQSAEELYESEWKPFEHRWWRKDVAQGRIVRPRLDVFLNYWLVMRLAEEVQVPEVFDKFKGYAISNGNAVEHIVRDMKTVGAVYRGFDDVDEWSPEGTFLYRWRLLDAGVITPVLLWLFSQPADVLGEPARLRSLRALESFLVRRMVCRMTTKDYNKLFLELLGKLDHSPAMADDAIVGFLATQDAESRVWPDDHMFEAAIVDLPLYRLLTRGRLRMVLEAIEDSLRTPLSEENHVQRSKLTIEHILPQSWRDYWPLDESGIDAELTRERLLHSLGNLTLVNKRLNPSMSNDPWLAKQEALQEHSVLHVNKHILASYGASPWDEPAIRDRGRTIAARAMDIWPSAENLD